MTTKETCKVCHGWGRDKKKMKCPHCDGNKYKIIDNHAVDCEWCKGVGSLWVGCQACGGTGWNKPKGDIDRNRYKYKRRR